MAEIAVLKRVLASNDAVAARQLELLQRNGILSVNLMSGPGAGKTALIEKTLEKLASQLRIHVIEGDLCGDIDARRIAARGVPCTQINTEGGCHLDAVSLEPVIAELPLDRLDLLLIENVGNLVCPAEFAMPAQRNVTLLSVAEGSDKPIKYPYMFAKSDLVVVTKTDLLPYVDFDLAALRDAIGKLKPGLRVLALSVRTGDGLADWLDWVVKERALFARTSV